MSISELQNLIDINNVGFTLYSAAVSGGSSPSRCLCPSSGSTWALPGDLHSQPVTFYL